METIVDQWRLEEKADLLAIYHSMLSITQQEDPISFEQVSSLANDFGISRGKIKISDKQDSLVVCLQTEVIEITNKKDSRESQKKKIERWIEKIEKKSIWNKYQETDGHIVHMHLKRLHGEKLKESESNLNPYPYRLDAMETDSLTIHLASKACENIDEGFFAQAKGTIEEKKQIIARALIEIEKTGPRWATIPGVTLRGIQLHADYKNNDGVTIEGDVMTLSRANLPEALCHQDFNDRKIHDIIDIDGFRDDELRVKSTSLTKDNLILRFSRHAIKARHRIIFDWDKT